MGSPEIGGFALEPFSELRDIFRQNFELGLESSGAAFAVYHNDQLVVDLYGGYADRDKRVAWKEDTMTVIFSITKEISAMVLAMLIDQGYASYDHRVCRYWPRFALNNKREITIRQVCNHQAGLVFGNQEFTIEDVQDPEKMAAKFEQMAPMWTPGLFCGYHTLTFGFLIDQIVRRIDPQKRGVADYLRDEVIEKYDLKDISIGLKDDEENSRVATIYEKTDEELEKEEQRNPEAVRRYRLASNKHVDKVYENWPWVQIPDYNKLEVRRLPMASNMGISTARSLARLHYLIVQGKLLSEGFLKDYLSKPQLENQMDLINCYPESKGLGWQFYENRFCKYDTGKCKWIIGHSGYGGQNVRVDPSSDLAIAYLCNGLKAADAENVQPFSRLQARLYEILQNCNRSSH